MHHIGAILPIPHLLQRLSTNAAIRFRTLPYSSQVLARTPPTWAEHSPNVPVPLFFPNSVKNPPTIIYRLANLMHPKSEHILPYYTPPWSRRHSWGPRLITTVPSPKATRRVRAEYVDKLKARLKGFARDPTTLVIFTDGSRRRANGHRRTGAGYVAYIGMDEVRAGRWGLGRRAGTYDAEMLALSGGAAAAVNLLTQHPHL
ncbi:hypothetical protein OF83DRAFT_1022112, partial [Amylostereum chailletii]